MQRKHGTVISNKKHMLSNLIKRRPFMDPSKDRLFKAIICGIVEDERLRDSKSLK